MVAGAEPSIYFSDVFGIDPKIIEEYGAFNLALVNDLPLFVDPFLLYDSENPVYRGLHNGIIKTSASCATGRLNRPGFRGGSNT